MRKEFIFGIHAAESAIINDATNIQHVWVAKSRKDKRIEKVVTLLNDNQIPYEATDNKMLDKLSKGQRHQGVVIEYQSVGLLTEKQLDSYLDKSNLLILILDGVKDPHNLGACLRTADACGVDFVIIPKDNAVGITPVVRKVASGAAETMPVFQVTNLVRVMQKIQKAGVWITGTSGNTDIVLYDHDLTGNTAIVMGAEEKGMRRLTTENCDALVKIPMLGQVESLNVSVATAVCLYEAIRQRQ